MKRIKIKVAKWLLKVRIKIAKWLLKGTNFKDFVWDGEEKKYHSIKMVEREPKVLRICHRVEPVEMLPHNKERLMEILAIEIGKAIIKHKLCSIYYSKNPQVGVFDVNIRIIVLEPGPLRPHLVEQNTEILDYIKILTTGEQARERMEQMWSKRI